MSWQGTQKREYPIRRIRTEYSAVDSLLRWSDRDSRATHVSGWTLKIPNLNVSLARPRFRYQTLFQSRRVPEYYGDLRF